MGRIIARTKSPKKTQAKNQTHSVRVSLGARSYDVHIGAGLATRLAALYRGADSKRAVLISDERLTEHRESVKAALARDGWNVSEIAVEAGESLKELSQLYPVYGKMLKAGIDRSSTLFALGGGTIGDAAGFVASTYLRGIPWVGLPTTLLSQVDSAIGGKTAVNHPEGKNLIGTFHQPSLVVCDTDFLKTLSRREIVSGLGEAVKYGLTLDPKLLDFLRENWEAAVSCKSDVMTHVVQKSAAIKAKIVAKDEFDRSGVREVLNFGHTFGHALEKVTSYRDFQHGEAVIWGMRFALALSHVKRRLPQKVWTEADGFLATIDVPALPKVAAADFFAPMIHDKKAKDGKVRFVLLKKLGETVLDRKIESDDLHKAFELLKNAREVSRGR